MMLSRSAQRLAATPGQQHQQAERQTPLARVIDDNQFAAPFRPTPEEISQSYEQWMKLAADNKINAANTWNLGLIDYFHDMLMLREGESINFQKASCTLDGCVKIYTSRVDSVASETEKLVSGLVDKIKVTLENGGGNDEEEDNGDEKGAEDRTRRRRAKGPAKTLEKDFTSITLKKFDLEFSVDPLFRKTSADFDEEGAKGLLLNHLSTYGEARIIFDASDAVTGQDDEDIEGAEDIGENQYVDISKLKTRFNIPLSDLMRRTICPSLQHFKFNSTPTAFDNLLLNFTKSEPDPIVAAAAEGRSHEDQDFDNLPDNEHFDEADIGAEYVDFQSHMGADAPEELTMFGNDGNEMSDDDEDADQDQNDGEIPGSNEQRYVVGAGGPRTDILTYFDDTLARNWAGPEHWKLRKIAREKTKGDVKEPKERKKKEPFVIDFISGIPPDAKELFTPGVSSINLPRNFDRSGARFLLPPDVRFSSKDVLRMFMKPKTTITFKVTPHQGNGGVQGTSVVPITNTDGGQDDMDEDLGGDVDFNAFEAPVEEDEVEDERKRDIGDFRPMDDTSTAMQSSQYFLDDDQDEAIRLGDYDEGDAIYPTIRRTNKMHIHYAKTAKRVDVKRLKDNIWRKLSHSITTTENETPNQSSHNIDKETDTPQTFTSVVASLADQYPKQQFDDISIPFCFICLLHLANEKGLEIEGKGMRELIIRHH